MASREADTERFASLTREFYTPVEIAYMTLLKVETIRSYIRKPSKKHVGYKLLRAKKNNGSWRVTREDLIIFFHELYGD